MSADIGIEHRGYTARLVWIDQNPKWKPGWWLHFDGSRIPVGGDGEEQESLVARVISTYIGDPPPDDHTKIWGGYTCSDCTASGVKLWRSYQVVLDGQVLRCTSCCQKHEGKERRDDSIGWSVPAVPTPDGETFWGYTSVPAAAAAWWRALPD